MFQLRGDKRLLRAGTGKLHLTGIGARRREGNGRRMRRNRLFEIPCNLVRLVEKAA